MWRGSRPVGHCPKFGSERPETGDRGGGWAETRGEHNEESGARHSVTTHSGPGDPPLIGQWSPLIGQWLPHTGLWLVTLLLPTIWVFSLPGCWQMVFVFSDSHFLLLQAQSHKLLSGEKQENNYLGPSSRGKYIPQEVLWLFLIRAQCRVMLYILKHSSVY